MARVILSTLLLAVLLPGAVVLAQDVGVRGPLTQSILNRGHLNCGVPFEYPGFGAIDDAGVYEGIDIDVCRAIAVALFGDADAISYRPLRGVERQAAIQGGEVDLISRLTTRTLSRDTTWGVIYGPTTFYDGQGIGTRVELGVTTMEEMDGASICVTQGTTTELNISDAVAARGLDITILTQPDIAAAWQAYLDGRCEAWTTDKSSLAALHATSEIFLEQARVHFPPSVQFKEASASVTTDPYDEEWIRIDLLYTTPDPALDGNLMNTLYRRTDEPMLASGLTGLTMVH